MWDPYVQHYLSTILPYHNFLKASQQITSHMTTQLVLRSSPSLPMQTDEMRSNNQLIKKKHCAVEHRLRRSPRPSRRNTKFLVRADETSSQKHISCDGLWLENTDCIRKGADIQSLSTCCVIKKTLINPIGKMMWSSYKSAYFSKREIVPQ